MKVDGPPVLPAATASPPAQRSLAGWLLAGLAALFLAIALVVLHQFDPLHSGFYPGCTFHKVTGLNCPGCGGLRATHHLLHGRVVTALRHNALVVLGAPVAAAWAGQLLWRRWRGLPDKGRGLSARWLWALFGLMLLFTALRNLPVPWLAWLSP